MTFKNPTLVVTDMEASLDFYQKLLGLEVLLDFGANKTLTGGLVLQTLDTYRDFLGGQAISFGGKNFELYFEEEDFDGFVERLKGFPLSYVHPVLTHSWGQRVVRFYDPDGHIIEVAEPIQKVCRRFLEEGMTPEETAKRMDVPLAFVQDCMGGGPQ